MKRRIRRRAQKIKLLLMDCDGVLTDGRIWLTADGDEQKAFHVRDGLGIQMLSRRDVQTAIISGRASAATERRAQELKIDHVRQGVEDKERALAELLAAAKVEADECAFVGDDLTDLPVMKGVGLSIAVGDAHEMTKRAAHYVTRAAGGMGAVRETCELIITAQTEANRKRSLESLYEEYWGALALPIFVALILRFALLGLSRIHWSLEVVVASALIVGVALLLMYIARLPPRYPVSYTLSLFALVVFAGAATCSHLSYFVYSRNPAAYAVSSEPSVGRFMDFYLWYFVDLIPLKIWETLNIGPPIRITSRAGGIPLILFRIVVATPVLILVPKWYRSRFVAGRNQ